MTERVYILGAGFNRSVLWSEDRRMAPVSQDFLKVLLNSRYAETPEKLKMIMDSRFGGDLLDQIRKYWRLEVDDLGVHDFDVEECLTLLESIISERGPDTAVLARASFALRKLMLLTLNELPPGPNSYTDIGRHIGREVLDSHADVITFNYDVVAETFIQGASRMLNWSPSTLPFAATGPRRFDEGVQSSYPWNRTLAYGITFENVDLPISGPFGFEEDGRGYYSRPENKLYDNTRVLKLHGSINWLRSVSLDTYRAIESPPPDAANPPQGLSLRKFTDLENGYMMHWNGWPVEPTIIPPLLYKPYHEEPFKTLWSAALDSLSVCNDLRIIGYSFPPTDFRVRRLLREAFTSHSLNRLTVVNPSREVDGIVRGLTHYEGNLKHYESLGEMYGIENVGTAIGN